MNQIIRIDDENVQIGTDDNRILTVPKASLNFDDPQIGDCVTIFQSPEATVVSRDVNRSTQIMTPNTPETRNVSAQINTAEKRCNKHVFVWVCNFLFGNLGIDRFIRGQIGLGILKLLTVGAFGIWSMVDFIISLVKAYGNAFNAEEDVIFINGKYAR